MNYHKYYIFLIFFISTSSSTISQDMIFLKDYNDTIYCQIISDKITSIEYKLTPKDTLVYKISFIETEGYTLGEQKLSKHEQDILDSTLINYYIPEKYIQPGIYYSVEEFTNDNPKIKGEVVGLQTNLNFSGQKLRDY